MGTNASTSKVANTQKSGRPERDRAIHPKPMLTGNSSDRQTGPNTHRMGFSCQISDNAILRNLQNGSAVPFLQLLPPDRQLSLVYRPVRQRQPHFPPSLPVQATHTGHHPGSRRHPAGHIRRQNPIRSSPPLQRDIFRMKHSSRSFLVRRKRPHLLL